MLGCSISINNSFYKIFIFSHKIIEVFLNFFCIINISLNSLLRKSCCSFEYFINLGEDCFNQIHISFTFEKGTWSCVDSLVLKEKKSPKVLQVSNLKGLLKNVKGETKLFYLYLV
jgi:hypothetical protein